jgi:hypothetical protein
VELGPWLAKGPNKLRPRERLLKGVTIISCVLIVPVTVGLAFGAQRDADAVKAEAWLVPGPPCRAIARRDYIAFGTRVSSVFYIDGVRFARGYGYAKCDNIQLAAAHTSEGIPVCQFNDPAIVEVTTGIGDFFYMTGSSPSTISVVRGQPSCVLNARLKPDWRLGN